MKKEVFKEKERVFFTCPYCGAKHTFSACRTVVYEEVKYECTACKTPFDFYINQMGKVFTEVENRLEYIGYVYKVL